MPDSLDNRGPKGVVAGRAALIGSFTMVSRVLGYLRDAVIAAFFGASFAADSFFVAFRVSNLLRRLVGEGALTSSFIPVFTDVLSRERSKEGPPGEGSNIGEREKGDGDSRDFVSSLFTLLFIILLILSIGGILFAEELVGVMAPGFTEGTERFELTVRLTRIMFPYMVLIGLTAIAMGVLNTLKHFTAPALSPVLLNIAIVLSALYMRDLFTEPVYALSGGVLLGGVMQLGLQVPYLRRYGYMPSFYINLSDKGVKRVLLLMGPAVLGVGVYQLNIFVTMRFASHLAEGSVSYLYYASRLMELPLGVFGVAVATAVLPSLSASVTDGRWSDFHDSLSFGIRLVVFITLPATVGLIILGEPIIELLFKRGEFGGGDVGGTSTALLYYAIGIVPVGAARILVSVFYSLNDTKTPVKIAFVALLANIAFCYLLVRTMGHGGLALATTLSAFVNVILIYIFMKRRLAGLEAGTTRIDGLGVTAVRSGVASLVMAVLIYLASYLISLLFGPAEGAPSSLYNLLSLTALILIGISSYLGVTWALRMEEITVISGLRKR